MSIQPFTEQGIKERLGRLVTAIEAGEFDVAMAHLMILYARILLRHGCTERIQETCDALEERRRSLVDKDKETAPACATRASERWALKR